ncbi:MAG TPA: alanine racemase [Stellaceae bacterium]|nr:alanine racemase [Stellaceae bacterium]
MASDPAAARAGAVLDIDLAGIVENWRLLARHAAPALCTAVVKANGYGLGAVPVARALLTAGCRMFFVATLDEGIALRQGLGGAPEIAVFNGPLPGTADEFAEYGLTPVLNEPGQIAEWAALAPRVLRDAPLRGAPQDDEQSETAFTEPPNPEEVAQRPSRRAHGVASATSAVAILHVDTGLSRLGLSVKEFMALLDAPPRIAWRAVISHLACADRLDHPLNERQRARFAAAAAQLPGVPAGLAASSGIFLGPSYHFDLVRPGAALFGVNPVPGRPNPLRQILRLRAKIVQVRQIDSGESVGYGAAHVMKTPGRAATVAVGYGDGWLRSLSHRGCGYLAGARVPVLGRVSMDLVTFDVSAVAPELAHPGATIELLGAQYGVDDAAADAGTIGYEILCALGSRYHRVYRESSAAPLSE